MKLSEQIKNCLDGSSCGNCEHHEADTKFICRGLLEKAYERIKGYEDMFPCKVGDTVYVIGTCEEVENILDGTMYGVNGEPGTATGYYCPYYLNENCPHEDCDDCEQCRNKLAVFEDEVEGFGVYDGYTMLYTKNIKYCADVENNFGRTAFLVKEDADKALQKMNEMEGK